VNLAAFKGLRCIDGCEDPAAVGNSYNPGQLFPCSKDLRKICLSELLETGREETPDTQSLRARLECMVSAIVRLSRFALDHIEGTFGHSPVLARLGRFLEQA
jgi:hypothetical protein